MAKNFYMHTLDGRPASFYKGQGVLYTGTVELATSLRQIRAEQRESRAIFARRKMIENVTYGYVRVVPVDRTSQ